MKPKTITVHEAASITGITIRTLHYYDETGLLQPTVVTDARYRLYTDDDLDRLQQILFYKEVGFELKEIKKLMSASIYSKHEALRRHLDVLNAKRKRMDELIRLVNDTLTGKRGCSFAEFSNADLLILQKKYRKEAAERWQTTKAYKGFLDLSSNESSDECARKWYDLLIRTQSLFEKLAEYEGVSPASPMVQDIVREWQGYITANFYQCSDEMLLYLGELYESDDRFSQFINRCGKKNLAAFFNRAIKAHNVGG